MHAHILNTIIGHHISDLSDQFLLLDPPFPSVAAAAATAMSSPIPCNVCRSPGSTCAHTDLNRALPLFGVDPLRGAKHELQLCGHDEMVYWLLNDSPPPEESAAVAASGLKCLDRLREANPRDGATTFGTVCLSHRSAIIRPVSDPKSVPVAPTTMRQVAAPTASAIVSASCSLFFSLLVLELVSPFFVIVSNFLNFLLLFY